MAILSIYKKVRKKDVKLNGINEFSFLDRMSVGNSFFVLNTERRKKPFDRKAIKSNSVAFCPSEGACLEFLPSRL